LVSSQKTQKVHPSKPMAKWGPFDFQKVYKVLKTVPADVPLEIFHKNPYKALISTVMSARTNDNTTLLAAKRLFKIAPNIKSLSELSQGQISKLIFPVGFYKTKSKHLKQLSQKVISDFDGKIPKSRYELISLPGVGRKTANLVLNRAFNIPAIAVDTHVHKITNLLGWVHTNSPQETEMELIRILPKKYWSETNRLFVSLGRRYNTDKKLKAFLRKNNLI
jgi:endonuclease III